MPSTRQPSRPASQAAIRSQAAARAASLRTMPPFPTAPRPTSNCGLISATSRAPGAARASGAGSTVSSPMKLASQVIASTGSGTCSAVM